MRYRWKNGYTYRITDEDVLCENKFAEECEPDWDDPATMGCLLAQVREVYPRAWTTYFDDTWYVVTNVALEWTTVSARKTESDALLAALGISDWPY